MNSMVPQKDLLKISLLFFMLPVLAWRIIEMTKMEFLPMDDFVEYWSASRLLLEGRNPYSDSELFALQKSVGSARDTAVIMYNPPWTLFFILPLGLFSFANSRAIWILVHLMTILLSSHVIWNYYHGPRQYHWLASILAMTFFPVIFALRTGQITPFLVLGLAGFLWFEKENQLWLAGFSILLIAIKPHLFFLFWLALICWLWRKRAFELVGGTIIGCIFCVIIPLLFDHNLVQHYVDLITKDPPSQFIPNTLGGLLRVLVGYHALWPQFMPSLIGVFWLLYQLKRQGQKWEWRSNMPILLTVSLLSAAYGWVFDLVVLIPAVLYYAARITTHQITTSIFASSLFYGLIILAAWFVNLFGLDIVWYCFMTLALLLCFIALDRSLNQMKTGLVER